MRLPWLNDFPVKNARRPKENVKIQSDRSVIQRYQRLFETESIDLSLAEEALAAIARKGDRPQDRRTGPALDHGDYPA
jgi:ATP-dependent protease Clp ATPase subunit